MLPFCLCILHNLSFMPAAHMHLTASNDLVNSVEFLGPTPKIW